MPRLVGLTKFEVTCELLRDGFVVLFSELDVFWLRDAWSAVLDAFGRRDAALRGGSRGDGERDAIAAMDNVADGQLNIGFYCATPGPRVARFYEALSAACSAGSTQRTLMDLRVVSRESARVTRNTFTQTARA